MQTEREGDQGEIIVPSQSQRTLESSQAEGLATLTLSISHMNGR